jgi:4-amino-4-deoxy-L-arabinose transferase-like glycosyltransferase
MNGTTHGMTSKLAPSSASTAPDLQGRWLAFWVGLCIFAWFATLGVRDLIGPDEGRYAELARGMLESGDWIVPRLNGILYFEKPPLQYWATAVSFALFGYTDWAARLWPALTGAAAVLALWWTTRAALPRAGHEVALSASLMLGGCLWWLGNGHFISLDMGLSSFMAMALLSFWYAQRDQATPAQARWGMIACWAAMALALLSKGLIGLVLPGAVLFLYMVIERDLVRMLRLHWWPGLIVFAVIGVPWFVAVSLREPTFAHFFFIHEHVERFLSPGHQRTGAWYYFLVVLAVGLLPWTSLLPGALWRGWKRETGQFQVNRLLILWFVFILFFFSISSSKLPSYILPIFPAAAILIARDIQNMAMNRLRRHVLALAVFLSGLALAALVATYWLADQHRVQQALDMRFSYWVVGAALALAVSGWVAYAQSRQARKIAVVLALAVGASSAMHCISAGYDTYSRVKSAKQLSQALSQLNKSEPIYVPLSYDQTLPYYLGRTVTLVEYIDEFAMGMSIEPDRTLATVEQLRLRWLADGKGAIIMPRRLYEQWQKEGLPMQVIYEDFHRLAVVHPAQ